MYLTTMHYKLHSHLFVLIEPLYQVYIFTTTLVYTFYFFYVIIKNSYPYQTHQIDTNSLRHYSLRHIIIRQTKVCDG